MTWKEKLGAVVHSMLIGTSEVHTFEDNVREIFRIVNLDFKPSELDTIESMISLTLPWEGGEAIVTEGPRAAEGFYHTLSGNLLDIRKYLPDSDKALYEIRKRLELIKEANPDFEKLFHALWWHMPDLFPDAGICPADPRIPNYSVIEYLDSASAISGTVHDNRIDATLIGISVGPVQGFIEAARKTMDLWAGSYLLSLLIYKGIEVVGREFGFDSVVFPSMRGIPFVKDSLIEWGVQLPLSSKVPTLSKRVACLPNRFVAVVPSHRADGAIDEICDAIKDFWRDLANQQLRASSVEEPVDKAFLTQQLSGFPEVYAASQPLESFDDSIDLFESFYLDSSISREVHSLSEMHNSFGSRKPNACSLYPLYYRLLRSKLDAQKTIKTFDYFVDASSERAQILDGDQLDGSMKAIFRFSDGEKTDRLHGVNAVKRAFATHSSTENRFPSVDELTKRNKQELLKKGTVTQDNYENNYYAVLLMDGDRMGRWISGENAPEFSEVASPSFLQRIESNTDMDEDLKEYLLTKKPVHFTYHRTISGILNLFSSFVERVVAEHGGELVYAGGDDILAFLPAVSVLDCASKLRKIYSGIDSVRLNDDSGTSYVFDKEMVWINERPYRLMMGERATMSAGIAIVNSKFPLRSALSIARESERQAKDGLSRDSFVISMVKRSGQINQVGSRWRSGSFDVISESEKLLRNLEDSGFGMRGIRKLYAEDLYLNENEYTDNYLPYIVKKSDVPESECDNISAVLKEYFMNMSLVNNNEIALKQTLSHKQSSTGMPVRDVAVNMILAWAFLLRGDRT